MRFAWIAEPPFGYREDGVATGCDVELARHVFAAIGEQFEPIETEFAEMLPGLQDGRWYVATGMFVTPERARRAAFTQPIWGLRDGLLVAERDANLIDGYRSLARLGGKLAVLEGQVQRETALRLGVPEKAVVIFQDYREAAQAVAEGAVRAYASVERAHRTHLAGHPSSGLACIGVPVAEKPAEPGAFACRDAAIRDPLDGALGAFLGSDEHAALMARFGLGRDEMFMRRDEA